MDQDKKNSYWIRREHHAPFCHMDKDPFMINLNLLILIIFKSLRDLGLTLVGLGTIIYLAFFGFADKENWTPRFL